MVVKEDLEKTIECISSQNTWLSKIKRNIAAFFLPVDESREGKCRNCGVCCKLPAECPFLRYKRNQSYCAVYSIRPLTCRKYPRTEQEHLTKNICGYYFNGK
jgi:hypothetical protein